MSAPIDLNRYPIDRLASREGLDLVSQVKRDLADKGCAVLRDFVPPAALAEMAAQGRSLAHKAHFNTSSSNPYRSADDKNLPADHPVRFFMERTNGFVAGDRIAEGSMLRRLYHSDDFKDFIAACVGLEEVNEYLDPFAGLVFNVLRPGCQHPWHFDNNDFSVSLLTQEGDGGGRFEYCPSIRSDDAQNYEKVSAVLHGDRGPVESLALKPGDLQIFLGRNSMHRVTKVEGERQRHTAILAYAKEPDVIADPERTKRLFGRVSETHLAAAAAGRSVAAHRA